MKKKDLAAQYELTKNDIIVMVICIGVGVVSAVSVMFVDHDLLIGPLTALIFIFIPYLILKRVHRYGLKKGLISWLEQMDYLHGASNRSKSSWVNIILALVCVIAVSFALAYFGVFEILFG